MTAQPLTPDEPPGGLDPRFREIMDGVPVLVWVTDAARRCIWFNRAWLEYTGRSLAEQVGEGWRKSIHPDDLQRELDTFAAEIPARRPIRAQYRLRKPSGEYCWVQEHSLPRFAHDGSFLGYLGCCFDVENHKTTEEQLRRLQATLEARISETSSQLSSEIAGRSQAEQELTVLIQGIGDVAIYMLDPAGRVSSWNTGAARIKGYRAEEIVGHHFSRFYTESDRTAGVPEKALAIAAQTGKFEAEGWRRRKDGTQFWASVLIDAIRDSAGHLVGYAKITRDITEKKLAEQQLEVARKRMVEIQRIEGIGQLTGGVAHDFNNLLTVILGNLQIAERAAGNGTVDGTAKIRTAIDNAIKGARRAATLTQRLLAFSRRQPLAPKLVNLNKLIVGEVEFLQRTLGEQVEIEAVGGGGLWQIEVDVNQLEAALLNLAINARDAMPDGGKLTIETSNAYLDEEYVRLNPDASPGQFVQISVTDNGSGMTPEVMNRAFEPFFSTKEVGQGTGLGLSQVYGFIKQSGGHVKIYSELGEGTTIHIYLPRYVGPGATEQPQQLPQPAGAVPGETLLVVEDDADVRCYLVDILREVNYRVLEAPEASAALEILRRPEQHVDLLLTDVVLPRMNGRELARLALALRPGLKVLFMTGYSRNAIIHQGRLDQGVELIQKPLTQEQLTQRVRNLLDSERSAGPL
jgi:PAS domain S-box-containing protein